MQFVTSNQAALQEDVITNKIFGDLFFKIYFWLGTGIFITMFTSLLFYYSGFAQLIYLIPISFPLLIILQIALVFIISLFSLKLNSFIASLLFIFYSFTIGITFTVLFYAFSITSILITFFVASTMFIIMAAYGLLTRQDLTKIGNIALMGLLGLIMGSVLNIFFANQALDWLLTYIGIAVFLVLIASDTQKIKRMSSFADSIKGNLAIIGALTLYLDFINLFLKLLKIFGNRRR